MSKTNKYSISTIHLYNPPKQGVGRLYDNVVEGLEIVNEFHEENEKLARFINTCDPKDVLYVLIRAYKDTYPSTRIKGIYSENLTKYSFRVNLRKDLQIFWEDNNETNTVDTIIIKFKKTQDFSILESTIEEALSKNHYTKSNSVYTVFDSPIKKVALTPEKVVIHIHPSKVIQY